MKAQAAARERYESTGKMDVEKYSSRVISEYQHRAALQGAQMGRASTVYVAAENVSVGEGVNAGRAGKVAGAAIDGYEAKVGKGMEPEKARNETAKEMAKRFDERGYDLERKTQRSRDGLSL